MYNSIAPPAKVRFGDWIGEGWNMFTAEWKVWVVNALVLFLAVSLPLGAVVIIFYFAALTAVRGGGEFAGIALLLLFGVIVFVVLAQAFLTAGMYRCAFKQLRGERISTGDLFSGGDKMLPLLGASILVGILTVIGFALCIVPGFLVIGAMYFTFPLVVERDLGVIDAMTTSRDTTRGDMWMFVLFAFIVLMLNQAAANICFLALLVTQPLQYTIAAVAFRDCFGVQGARSFKTQPSAPPQSYGAPPTPGYQPTPPSQGPGYGMPQGPTPSASAPFYYQPPSQPQSPPSSAAQTGATPSTTAPQQDAPTSAVPQQPTAEIVCPGCQAVLPTSARFCARCGRGLTVG